MYKTEADLPADVYSQFYEEVSANPEGAMVFIANWAYRKGRDSLQLDSGEKHFETRGNGKVYTRVVGTWVEVTD